MRAAIIVHVGIANNIRVANDSVVAHDPNRSTGGWTIVVVGGWTPGPEVTLTTRVPITVTRLVGWPVAGADGAAPPVAVAIEEPVRYHYRQSEGHGTGGESIGKARSIGRVIVTRIDQAVAEVRSPDGIRVIGRDIDTGWVGWLDRHQAIILDDLYLVATLERSRLKGTLTHSLHRPHDVAHLVTGREGEGRGPLAVLVERLKDLREIHQGFDRRIPRFGGRFRALPLSNQLPGLSELLGIGRSAENVG